MMGEPLFFGIRHFSPAGAFYLRRFLDRHRPELVLIEGPSDFNDQIENLVGAETVPPLAILAYTDAVPVQTLLYPLAEYSPEYQALLWCKAHNVSCRFIDLPAEVFLALRQEEQPDRQEPTEAAAVYQALEKQCGADGEETFWERTLEHAASTEAYRRGAIAFGHYLRAEGGQRAENAVREAYMRWQIQTAVQSGIAPDKIVVVTGAYHVDGLQQTVSQTEQTTAALEKELQALPRVSVSHTLMPYSFYRLSSRSGYGAGNNAPAYYGLVWEALCAEKPYQAVYSYLSHIAQYQRAHGTPVSAAEVIEAVRLAVSLAALRDQRKAAIPVLRDLRDAAITCMGGGSAAALAMAIAHTEIGTAIGSLPDGISRTSMQEDFYRQLKQLKLEKYRTITVQELALDLREKRTVKSEQAAFLDLNRSFFLHQLRVLGIGFGTQQKVKQDNATWAEQWQLRWTSEVELELVESALKGDTILQATSFVLKERIEQASGMAEIAQVIEDGFACGMLASVVYATAALQAMTVEEADLKELAETAEHLSTVLQYGTIRKLDAAPLQPILQQLFFRACLILPSVCVCDDGGSQVVATAIEQLNRCALALEFLNQENWITVLREVAQRDDLNAHLSGLATAVLLEQGELNEAELRQEVQRRLSRGIPADIGAGWFEGLAKKNRYALIARLSVWDSLDGYLDTLDDEEFKRALLFLRRAFADFTAAEKDAIAENLGELWGLNQQQVSQVINTPLTEEGQTLLDSLDDFDFDL